jgi:hypothetical protein
MPRRSSIGHLFISKNFPFVNPLILIKRHTVGAAEVTPIRDGYPQVLHRPMIGVTEHLHLDFDIPTLDTNVIAGHAFRCRRP